MSTREKLRVAHVKSVIVPVIGSVSEDQTCMICKWRFDNDKCTDISTIDTPQCTCRSTQIYGRSCLLEWLTNSQYGNCPVCCNEVVPNELRIVRSRDGEEHTTVAAGLHAQFLRESVQRNSRIQVEGSRIVLRELQRLHIYIYAADGFTGGSGQNLPVHGMTRRFGDLVSLLVGIEATLGTSPNAFTHFDLAVLAFATARTAAQLLYYEEQISYYEDNIADIPINHAASRQMYRTLSGEFGAVRHRLSEVRERTIQESIDQQCAIVIRILYRDVGGIFRTATTPEMQQDLVNQIIDFSLPMTVPNGLERYTDEAVRDFICAEPNENAGVLVRADIEEHYAARRSLVFRE